MHDEDLEDLQRTLDHRRQGQMPAEELIRCSETEESTAKSEDDGDVNLYHATPQPRAMPQIRTNSHIAGLDHTAFEEDINLLTITEVSIKLYDGMRMPELIENLSSVPDSRLPEKPSEIFNFEFLRKVFGGQSSFKRLVDDEHLTFPLFIRLGQDGYKYYGTYTEPRYSDRLGGNEMRQVPEYVKKHWASQIGATPRDGKIPKHNETIRASWPKVPVGWLIDNHKKLIPYQEERHDDYEESPVTRLITADEADEVGEDEILMAFETADTDTAPSVRLFYEYLQCVGYDHDFYGKLVAKKLELEDAH